MKTRSWEALRFVSWRVRKYLLLSCPDPFLENMERVLCVWLKNGYGCCQGTTQRGVQRHAEGGRTHEDHSTSLVLHDNFQPASPTSFEKAPTPMILCLSIINLHTIFCMALTTLTAIPPCHKALTRHIAVSSLADFSRK
jgi:hypothetical protein